ncbi:type II toxin-antitoxin system RelB/DinJ family antitoxin [Chromatium okenii]|uniref:type II toxin-antitoxin system RelB/DinJ family antitoxin n=1 Tax=Chromatium okenii TaxID=61644 RepID=UPI0026ECB7AB|nr:type II toxin-antitoxin system RelB/DinJ family antitoxin [Chromatium okenii]MBV5309665.1 type II toxin-antitoxin system RelB/DinJ family antitoxin [Chromatium okenii]
MRDFHSTPTRIDSDTKARAALVLANMGLSMSDVIRLLIQHIADEQQLPVALQSPNAVTRQAMSELETGHGQSSETIDALMADLHADD